MAELSNSEIVKDLNINNAKKIIIRTGNIISELNRKTTLSATDELVECLNITLTSWTNEVSNLHNAANIPEVIDCRNSKTSGKISKDERKELKLTVKVLVNSFQPEVLSEAISIALEELDVTVIESVIVAFPVTEEKLKLTQIQDMWIVLENLVEKGKILTIGISDLDTELLIELYSWAKIKPSVNQVNLATCCVIPVEMQTFAKDNDIQLLTHSDPREILPTAAVVQLLSKVSKTSEDLPWESRWTLRYSALVKCRGVIQNKGFVACLQNVRSLTDNA